MKIALVHDYLVQYGGAERVLECFCELYPEAPIYTLVHDKEVMRGHFADRRIYTSFLQKMPFSRAHHRLFPLLMPSAIESFDFSAYDVVLSDSSSYAKGIITKPHTLHICYMHTPMRYAWDDCQKYTRDFHFPSFIKKLVPWAMNPIRLWDRASADRVDKIIANSGFVAKRIAKYYRREAEVIHPPVMLDRFHPQEDRNEGYYLMVGRLIAYKRTDIAIEAFNKMGLPLKIVGRGPELKRLQKKAAENIEFCGRLSDEELAAAYRGCRAVVFPQEEDFGIVAIEALASGKPLIAFAGGDIVEHVKEAQTGVLFGEQSPASIIDAVRRFEKMEFDGAKCRAVAKKFDREEFKRKIKEYVEREVAKHKDM
ncbi:MAG TPA: glycosyltransferase [Candidatus Moranbacteria bacterium]|nr:glycosyltransferase [Candidatus Moranbacteria bacterium]